MSKKAVLSIIGFACLVAGIYCAFVGLGSQIVKYSLFVVGAFLFLGPIIGVRRVISVIIIAALSVLAYYAVVYVLGLLGLVLDSKGRTTIFLISVLFVYIFSSFFTKRN